MEAAVSGFWYRRTGYQPSRAAGFGADSQAAGADTLGYPQKAGGWYTHWSCRKLAAELGVSKDAVHRVWKEAGLKPHRLERYMASADPDFETKAADIIGLYLNPPEHAAVFCVDEKTAIQALDRLDPILPLSHLIWRGLRVRSCSMRWKATCWSISEPSQNGEGCAHCWRQRPLSFTT
jgi:hypothetical protein